MKSLHVGIAGAAMAAMLAVGPRAQAVNLQAGTIEASGTTATVDLWFFTINPGGPFTTGVNLTPLGGPFTTEDMSLLLYTESGGLIGAFLGAAGAIGAPRSARIDIPALASGDYVAIVSATELTPGEFGPTQSDPNVSITIPYELILDLVGGNESTYTCSIEGTLRGSFDITRFTSLPPGVSADCLVPSSTVPEPTTLAIILAGLMATGIARLSLTRLDARRAASSRC